MGGDRSKQSFESPTPRALSHAFCQIMLRHVLHLLIAFILSEISRAQNAQNAGDQARLDEKNAQADPSDGPSMGLVIAGSCAMAFFVLGGGYVIYIKCCRPHKDEPPAYETQMEVGVKP